MDDEIIIKNFNPSNKEFKFNFTRGECDKLSTGICPIERDLETLADKPYDYKKDRFSYPRCQDIYFGLREKTILNIPFVMKCGCGHYVCNDGRHRICVAQKMGLTLDVEYANEDTYCIICECNNNESIEEVTPIDINKTKKIIRKDVHYEYRSQ